jgi:hypothetical protein
MSDLTGLAAISTLFLTSAFVFMIITRMTNDLGDQIVTGLIRDHPISIEQRWLMLYSRWIAYAMTAVGVPLFLALAAAMMANHAGGADSRLLGRLAAFLLTTAGSTWLILGSVHFISYRSLLRQADAG